jgi:hypothetical protein
MSEVKDVSTMTPQELDAEINSLQHDPASPYHDSLHFRNKEVRERVNSLYAARYPESDAEKSAPEAIRSLAPHLEGLTEKDIEESQDKIENLDTDRDLKKVEDTLKVEWGQDYDAKIADARGVFSQLPQELQTWVEEHGLSNDVEMVTHLSEIGRLIRTRAKK